MSLRDWFLAPAPREPCEDEPAPGAARAPSPHDSTTTWAPPVHAVPAGTSALQPAPAAPRHDAATVDADASFAPPTNADGDGVARPADADAAGFARPADADAAAFAPPADAAAFAPPADADAAAFAPPADADAARFAPPANPDADAEAASFAPPANPDAAGFAPPADADAAGFARPANAGPSHAAPPADAGASDVAITSAVVIGRAGEAEPVAAGVALALRGRAAAAAVIVVTEHADPTAEGGTRAARRLAARLGAHGFEVGARGRLAWVYVTPGTAHRAVRVAGEPSVLVITVPLDPALELAIEHAELAIVVARDEHGPLARLATASLACHVVLTRPLPRRIARLLARRGLRAPAELAHICHKRA